MGDLYNKEVKPTIYCRGVELYPSTSVGEVIWAGETLVHNTNQDVSDLCHVVVYNSLDNKKYVVSDVTTLDPQAYVPIGIVVIPTNHDVYGTGECGVMALMSASLTNPNAGQSWRELIKWGGYKTDYPDLTNYNTINAIVDGSEATEGSAYLPSDNFDGVLSEDGVAMYYKNSSTDRYAPSAYNADGSRNDFYFSTSLSPYNVLSDFAGKTNTEFLCSQATSQPNWENDGTIKNYGDAGYHPAACCCWRYRTEGTSPGNWYLPAYGELGYCCLRSKKIDEVLNTLMVSFNKSFCLLGNSGYSSSSEASSYYFNTLDITDGGLKVNPKDDGGYVRPFTRMRCLPGNLHDLVWPFQETEDKPCSLPKYTDYIIFLGLTPPSVGSLLPTSIQSEEPVVQEDTTLGNYIDNPEMSTDLLETSTYVAGNLDLPASRIFWDIMKGEQVRDMTELPDGFYPMAVFLDDNYSGLYAFTTGRENEEGTGTSTEYKENYFSNKIFTTGGPELSVSATFPDIKVPTSWVLKIGYKFMSQNYGQGEDFNSETTYRPSPEDGYSRENLYNQMLESPGIIVKD